MRNGLGGKERSDYLPALALKDRLVEVSAYSREDSMMSGRLTVT